MEVEGFAGPAGSDGAGGGMLEAVHASELVDLGLVIMLWPAVRGGARSRDAGRGSHHSTQRVAGLPIGLGEHPTLGLPAMVTPPSCTSGVMPLT